MKKLALALSISFGAVVVPAIPSLALPPPESCLLDPGFGGTGTVRVNPPDDGSWLDRQTLDAQGRVYTTHVDVVDESYAVDRIRRFTADGQLDASFGVNGTVEVPGQVFNVWGRNVAVDDLGRVWFFRFDYTNSTQVLRFLPDGRIDPSWTPVEHVFGEAGRGDPFGDIEIVNGTDLRVVHGYTRTPDNPYTSIVSRTIRSDGSVIEEGGWNHPAAPSSGLEARILGWDDGWVAGFDFNGAGAGAHPMVWNASFQDSPIVSARPLVLDDVLGMFTGVQTVNGKVFAYGRAFTSEASEGSEMLVVEVDPVEGLVTGSGVTRTASRLDYASIEHVTASGIVIVVYGTGDSSLLAAGRLSADGTVQITQDLVSAPGIGGPFDVVEMPDGNIRIVGWSSFDPNEAMVFQLTPELGPAATSSSAPDQFGRLYAAFFGRAPDAGGQAFWASERASGVSLEAIADEFTGSDEFVDTYGSLTDEQFVELVYENVLGRPGEPTGIAFWTAELGAGELTRGALMVGFTESPEQIEGSGTIAPHDGPTGQLYRLYRAYFQRDSDAGGSCFWVRRLAGGLPLTSVSDAFAGSSEFQDTYGSLSNRAFVELVYSNVLGRPGEASGIDFWTGELDAGRQTRGQVMVGFSESVEFIVRTGTLPADS